jgi:hypothetical protein
MTPADSHGNIPDTSKGMLPWHLLQAFFMPKTKEADLGAAGLIVRKDGGNAAVGFARAPGLKSARRQKRLDGS